MPFLGASACLAYVLHLIMSGLYSSCLTVLRHPCPSQLLEKGMGPYSILIELALCQVWASRECHDSQGFAGQAQGVCSCGVLQ